MACTHGLSSEEAIQLAWHLSAADIQEDHICALCLSSITPKDDKNGHIGVCSNHGHTLIADVQRRELICARPCKDYVYLDVFDRAIQLVHAANENVQRGVALEEPLFGPAYQILTKRRRLQEQNLNGNLCLQACMPANTLLAQEFSEARSDDGLPLGLRGLNNLGNTCFMNCVLQAFIHTPLVRNFFLGDGHNPAHCEVEEGKPCLGCELDAVFNHVFSGDRQPFSPADFLFSWWTVADHLAEYQQQDAHEFYLSALSALCPAIIKPPKGSLPSGSPGTIQGLQATQDLADGRKEANGAQNLAQQGTKLEGCQAGPLRATQPVLLHPATAPSHAPAAAASAAAATNVKAQEPMHAQQNHLHVAPLLLPPLQLQQQQQQQQQQADMHQPLGGQPRPGGASQANHCGSDSKPDDSQPEYVHGLKQDGTQSLVDAVFRGTLRSDVTCTVCGYTSTAYDPFLDISLDLLPILEAVRQQESQLTEMRTCSQANTAGAPATAAAATTGVDLSAAFSCLEEEGPASMLSSPPSVSHPSASTPSQSGMTDAFSGVEGTSLAGASRHDGVASARRSGHASAIPPTGSRKRPADGRPSHGAQPPQDSAPAAAAAAAAVGKQQGQQQQQQQLLPESRSSPAASSSPGKQAENQSKAACRGGRGRGGSGTKRAAQEAFGDSNALLLPPAHSSRSRQQQQQQRQQQLTPAASEQAGCPAGPDDLTTLQPSGTPCQQPTGLGHTAGESISSDDDVMTSPVQGPGQQQQQHQQQQQQQQHSHQGHSHQGQRGMLLDGGRVGRGAADGSGSGSGGCSPQVDMHLPQHVPQPSLSHACSMQDEGGEGLFGVDPLPVSHPLVREQQQQQQQMTHEYPPGAQSPLQGAAAASSPSHTTAAAATAAAAPGSAPGSKAGGSAAGKGGKQAAGGGSKRGLKGKAKQPAVPRPSSRCGECHTCINKYMKKACLRNKALKDGDAALIGSSAAASPHPEDELHTATAAAATPAPSTSAPSPAPHPPPLSHAATPSQAQSSPSPHAASSAATAAAAAAAAAEAAAAAAMRPYGVPHAHTQHSRQQRAQPPLPSPSQHALHHHQHQQQHQHHHPGYAGRTAHGPPSHPQPPIGLPPLGLPPISSQPGGGASNTHAGAALPLRPNSGAGKTGGTSTLPGSVADSEGGLGAEAAGVCAGPQPQPQPQQHPLGSSNGLPPRPPQPPSAATGGTAVQQQSGRPGHGRRGAAPAAAAAAAPTGSQGGAASRSAATKQQQKQQARSARPSPARAASQAPVSNTDKQADGVPPAITLASCLQHYVQPEMLTSSASWVCSCCQCARPAVKQMSILRLPPVLCLHIKRFEYAPQSHRMLRKLQSPLAFPTRELDMAPFLTSAVLRQRYDCRCGCPMASMPGKGLVPIPTTKASALGDPVKASAGAQAAANSSPPGPKTHQPEQEGTAKLATAGAATRRRVANGKGGGDAAGSTALELAPPQSAGYQLSTVICHKGDITGGHYVAYVRNMGAWFRCDDAWVTLVTEQEVAQCQAYMLFFVQNAFA